MGRSGPLSTYLLAGLRDIDLTLLLLYAISIALFLRLFERGVRERVPRPLVTAGVGLGLVSGIAAYVLNASATRGMIGRLHGRPLAPVVAAGVLILAVGFVDLLLARAGRVVAASIRSISRADAGRSARPDVSFASALVLFVLVAATLLVMTERLDKPQAPSVSDVVKAKSVTSPRAKDIVTEATVHLPGAPLGLTFHGAHDGYIALAQGRILRFELTESPKPTIRWTVAAQGLGQVRGIAVAANRLFVSEIVKWPCRTPPTAENQVAACYTDNFPKLSERAAELRILNEAQGRISRLDIRPDGSLGPRVTLFDDLPVVDRDHAVNGIARGPDGMLYASIANVDHLWRAPQAVLAIHRPNLDLLGTIVRFHPDGGRLEVFAKGLRNVYGIGFSSDGHLYGVDNDGPAFDGYRGEEVLLIKQYADYGFPYETSAQPYHVRTEAPLVVLDTVGSAGVAWGPAAGFPRGLVTGSCGRLMYVGLSGGQTPKVVGDPEILLRLSECDAAVVATPQSGLLVALPSGTLRLLRLKR